MGDFERNFDLTAVDYDRIRPMYADEIYRDIFAYKDIGRDSQVLEIGMGTGKATVPVLDRQCRLTGIEPTAAACADARVVFINSVANRTNHNVSVPFKILLICPYCFNKDNFLCLQSVSSSVILFSPFNSPKKLAGKMLLYR